MRALTLAILMYTLGETAWAALELRGGSPFPSVADAFYVAYYVPLAVGLLRLARARMRPLETARILLDGVIVTAVIGLAVWNTLLAAILRDPALTLAERTISVAYPLMDVGLLGVLVLVALSGQRARAHTVLIAVGLALSVSADFGYVASEAGGTYAGGDWLDAVWAWAMVLLALGTWTARHHAPDASVDTHEPDVSARVASLLPLAAVVAVLGMLVWRSRWDSAHLVVLAVAAVVCIRHVVAQTDHHRMARALRRTSGELRAAQVVLSYRANHDALTGLRNRASLHEALRDALTEARVSGRALAVLFVDLDRMKQINDSHGHPTGDAVLREMSNRFHAVTGPDDVVGRVGGDEFVVLATGLTGDTDAAAGDLAERLIGSVGAPVVHAGHTFYLTASVGVALGPRDGDTPEALVQAADLAMYQAKRGGRNQWRPYDERTRQAALREAELELALREALEGGTLDLHYQPLWDLRDGRVVGFEALLRWQLPAHGEVAPTDVIPLAEERNLIVPLGEHVLRRALGSVRRWREHTADLYVTVNVSALHFARHDFVGTVGAALRRHALPGAALVLELTESALLHDLDDSVEKLGRLAALGVRVALDDFGTGYSSLSHLRQLPVQMVKIDRSFVGAMRHDGDVFVRAITMMTHGLGLTVVAEGLEEDWQRERVAALGGDVGQGYGLGRPMPEAEVDALLRGQGATTDDGGPVPA